MDRTYRTILEHISKVYDKHQARANKMNLEKRTQSRDGNQGPTKQEVRFFETSAKLAEMLVGLRQKMTKSTALNSNGQMKNYINIVIETARFVEIFNKKKMLNVKANRAVMALSDGTFSIIPKLDTALVNMEKGSGFCCGGSDSKKIFRSMMIEFRELAGNWRFLAEVEPKEMSESFISQPFNESEFSILKDILSRNWPEGNKVIQKERIVQVKVPYQVIKQVDRSKPNRLSVANQLIYGINREMHPTLGIQIYLEQADRNNNPDACNMLGQIYQLGQLLPKDYQKAMYYYKKSHDARNPYGIYLYARGFERGLLREQNKPSKQDLIMALKLYNMAAENNCPDACVELADIYQRGHFDSPNQMATVQRDLRKAFNYYCQARKLGSPKALNNLAVMYLKNKTMDENNPNNIINNDANVQKNQRTAVSLLEQSVAIGFPMAFSNLGNLYEKGDIVNKNVDKARELYYDGASKGCNKSKIAYAFFLINQTSIHKQHFEDEYRVAIKWLEEVVAESDRQQDTAKALYYLGVYYQYGFGIDKKPKKAVEYFEKAAFLQHPCAMNKLGNCYYSGFGVKVDQKIAIGYYKQAAQQGNDEALINLGTAYYRGVDKILDKNYHLAYDYFDKAMKAGNTDAYVHLSQMYEKGIVVEKDDSLANQLLVMGAYKNNQTAIYMLNERGQTVDSEMIAKFEQDFFSEPKPAGQNQTIPYIRDLNKAKSIVSKVYS